MLKILTYQTPLMRIILSLHEPVPVVPVTVARRPNYQGPPATKQAMNIAMTVKMLLVAHARRHGDRGGLRGRNVAPRGSDRQHLRNNSLRTLASHDRIAKVSECAARFLPRWRRRDWK